MDANVKKTVLRMIPYGLYVLTAKGKDDAVAAATVNWVTQASFEPPLIAVGVKTDSHAHALIKESKAFALNVLGKGQQALAFTFFKPAERQGQTISGGPSGPAPPAPPSSPARRPSWSARWRRPSRRATTRSSWARSSRLAWPASRRAAPTTRPSG
jgi:flavin reductase (DIM6/NTAB) family NADH-FMN oxidoreductase RutF